jgi:hypothetical protein
MKNVSLKNCGREVRTLTEQNFNSRSSKGDRVIFRKTFFSVWKDIFIGGIVSYADFY